MIASLSEGDVFLYPAVLTSAVFFFFHRVLLEIRVLLALLVLLALE